MPIDYRQIKLIRKETFAYVNILNKHVCLCLATSLKQYQKCFQLIKGTFYNTSFHFILSGSFFNFISKVYEKKTKTGKCNENQDIQGVNLFLQLYLSFWTSAKQCFRQKRLKTKKHKIVDIWKSVVQSKGQGGGSDFN